MKTLLLPSFLLLFPALATAQQVSLRGQVEDVQGTQNQFFLDCTDVSLVSSMFDLNTFVGLNTQIGGTWNGDSMNPEVVVTSIMTVAENFEMGGSRRIGEVMTFKVTGPVGSLAASFFSRNTGFVPLFGGVFLLRPINLFTVGVGQITPQGTFEVDVTIPNNPALVGVVARGQGVVVTMGVIDFTNPDCRTIEN